LKSIFGLGVNAYRNTLECIVLPKITQNLPQEFHPMSKFKIPSNIVLTDPNFNIPAEIDMLIAAQLFWQLICVGQIKACRSHPTLQKTKIGWVISGSSYTSAEEKMTAVCHLSAVDELNKSIAKFWEVEHDVSSNNTSHYTLEERNCEAHFQQNVCRDAESRFIVKLPTHDDKIQQLGDSQEITRHRFISLERRLSLQPSVYSQYRSFMQEYISLNHMQKVENLETNGKSYYLPHHAVFKESSTSQGP
jgi:hypothetical protein